MTTPGGESPTRMAITVSAATTQRGDTDREGAKGGEVVIGTVRDMSITRFSPPVATAAEPPQHNENGKKLRSEALKTPADGRSRMERMVQPQAQELMQLHRTTAHLANSLEAPAEYGENQWQGMRALMEAREHKWDARHKDNAL
jgi:hypothetical protein